MNIYFHRYFHRYIHRYFHALQTVMGIHPGNDIEPLERQRRLRIICTLGIVSLTFFAALNIFTAQEKWLGYVELLCTLLFFVPAALLLRHSRFLGLGEWLVLKGTLLASCSLIVLGGVGGTGLFWVNLLPFLIFFILGLRRGWSHNLGVLVCHALCITLINPNFAFAYPFPTEVSIRFLVSLVVFLLVAAVFSQARTRVERQLLLRKEEAEAATLAKSRFLAAASHDLRQPAHVMGLFVARLKVLPHDPQTRELVAGVDASVQALQDMLNAFFDYSRLDSQLTHASPCSFALNTLFDKLRTSFQHAAEYKDLRLHIRPTSVWVHSDPVLLQRVLQNLLNNAIQNTRSGSVVLCCRASSSPGHVRIQVRDSGKGIAPVHQKKVFEEFYQVENPARDRNKGLGLGLSIVERVCKLLQHSIALRSAPGCGSTFTVQVMLGDADPVHRPELPLGQPHSQSELRGMEILLIEDDALGRLALRGLLQSWGCTVRQARTAEDALLCCSAGWQPNFIITDFRLSGPINGVEAVFRVRTLVKADIAACVITGDTDTSVKQGVGNAGLALLMKPVPPAKLRSVLRYAWGSIKGSNSALVPLEITE
ncbi:MAG: ATP-binding protein [Rhodoferax sp.]|nr:ATP-binding protein [Rhodoferax sp.]